MAGEVSQPDRNGHWRDRLRAVLHRCRAILLGIGSLLPPVLSRPTRGEKALRMGEVMLECLRDARLESDRAVEALTLAGNGAGMVM